MADDPSQTRAGLLFGLAAYLIWGVMPLYFKLLSEVAPAEIVAHRILWSLVFLGVLVALWRRWAAIRAAAATGKVLITLIVTALLIAVNWLVYIYAVVSGHVLEGSLGYYLNPLVNVLFGVVLLKERLSRAQVFACLLAGAGVAVLAAGAGSGLWISLTLAISFASYGFLRKVVSVDALEGLWVETAILAPVGARLSDLAAGGGQRPARPARRRRRRLSDPRRRGDGDAAAAVHRGGAAAALFDARLPPIYRALAAVPARGGWRSASISSRAHAICFGAIWAALAIFGVEGVRAARSRAAAMP